MRAAVNSAFGAHESACARSLSQGLAVRKLDRIGIVFVVSVLCTALLFPLSAQEAGSGAAFGPYERVEKWLKPVDEGWLHPVALFAESADRIFVFKQLERGDRAYPSQEPVSAEAGKNHHFLVAVNRVGRVTERWTQWDHLLGEGHKVSSDPYDPEKHIWAVVRDAQQVLKFTNDGKRLVMAIGTRGVAGNDENHFNRPTDITWLPDGTFFVSDGDTNRRVVKFHRNGTFLQAWSTEEGPLAGFGTTSVHGIAVDAERRVYVAARNRTSGRIIIFDENGTHLSTWPGLDVLERVWISQDGFAWTQEGGNATGFLRKYDLNGKRLRSWSIPGTDISVDGDGNLYVQNFDPDRTFGVDKYVPMRNADRRELVGPRVGHAGAVTR